MIVISVEKSLNDAWLETLQALYSSPSALSSKYCRDLPALIKIAAPCAMEEVSPIFPMGSAAVQQINHYLVTGEGESEVPHEWSKLYRKRIFEEPYNQVEFVIRQLSEEETSGRTQISLWDKTTDQNAKIAPCTQILWFRRRGDSLEMHTHAHSSDAWNKLLMNIHEFHALQVYIAERAGLQIGAYYHFIDSCHIHQVDEKSVSDALRRVACQEVVER